MQLDFGLRFIELLEQDAGLVAVRRAYREVLARLVFIREYRAARNRTEGQQLDAGLGD